MAHPTAPLSNTTPFDAAKTLLWHVVEYIDPQVLRLCLGALPEGSPVLLYHQEMYAAKLEAESTPAIVLDIKDIIDKMSSEPEEGIKGLYDLKRSLPRNSVPGDSEQDSLQKILEQQGISPTFRQYLLEELEKYEARHPPTQKRAPSTPGFATGAVSVPAVSGTSSQHNSNMAATSAADSDIGQRLKEIRAKLGIENTGGNLPFTAQPIGVSDVGTRSSSALPHTSHPIGIPMSGVVSTAPIATAPAPAAPMNFQQIKERMARLKKQ